MSDRVRWQRQTAPIWGAVPPPPRLRKYPLVEVVGTQATELVIISDHLEETWTHFVDGRTVFCSGPEKGCWLDHALCGKPRYGAWLAVLLKKIRVTHLVRLTSVAVAVEPRLRERRGQLRGLALDVWRIGAFKGSEMNAKIGELVPEALLLPPPPDVRFCVERMLEAKDRAKHPNGGTWRPGRGTCAASAAAEASAKASAAAEARKGGGA